MRLNRFLLAPEPVVETGKVVDPVVPPVVTPDPSEGFRAALKKHGDDATSFARTLHLDAEALRKENAELRGKLPKAGQTLLDGDDATAWKELSAIGKPGEIKARLEAGDLAVTASNGFAREKLLASAAATLGYDAEVLGQLAGDLEIEVKDGQRQGKTVKVAEVTIRSVDDKGKEVVVKTPLEKHAEKSWGKYLPSLKAGSTTPARSSGTPIVRPGQGGTQPARREAPAEAPARKRLSF